MDHWEVLDVYKALLAVGAGIILGLEREMKDKVAGLKTITIICLGATLFSIISYKVGGQGNNTAIAAYIVSGVGFIGAGAIFKDGFSISGLTTAGIIWLAAAVGTAIGFGEFYLAATFMVASLVIIFLTPVINSLFPSRKSTRQITIVIASDQSQVADSILQAFRDNAIFVEEKKVIVKDGKIEITADLSFRKEILPWIKDYLFQHKSLLSFSI
jgi:putative Mg2+ transporter-C (MgtC) family protein